MKKFYIFDDSARIDRLTADLWKAGEEVSLFPLTSRTALSHEIGQKLEADGIAYATLPTAKMINAAAEALRGKYLGFIAELPEKIRINKKNLREVFAIDHESSLWWFSLLAEKGVFSSNAFSDLVKLDAIISTVKDGRADVVIIDFDNRALMSALREYLDKQRIKVMTLAKGRRLFGGLVEWPGLGSLYALFLFAIKYFWRTAKLKRRFKVLARRRLKKEKLLFITSYPNIDIASAEKGIFKNRYHKKLQDVLEQEGREIVWIIVYAHNADLPMQDALDYLERFIRNGYMIHLLEEFHTMAGQLKAALTIIWSGLKFMKLEKGIRRAHVLDDYNFYAVFRKDWYRSFIGPDGYRELLSYHMFRKLFKKQQLKKGLYFCEFQSWEKALISARNSVGSLLHLTGYQSGTVTRMLLNYFNDPREISDDRRFPLPKPELVVCNGQASYDRLKESGWPEERLSMAEAIRYDHLRGYLSTPVLTKKKLVLVALSISADEAGSILNVVGEAFKDKNDIEVWIKPHPALDMPKALALAGIDAGRFPIKRGPIEIYLQDARIVIAGQSGVSIEALAFGCEIIIVNVPEWFNMSPLKSIQSELIKSVFSPKELLAEVLNIFNKKYDPKNCLEAGRKIVNEFFCLDIGFDYPQRFLKLLGVKS